MYVDASAIIAIIAGESDSSELKDRLSRARATCMSALTYYEAVAGLTRQGKPPSLSRRLVDMFIEQTGAEIVVIDAAIGRLAVEAYERFGKGRHRAGLNMGDCFSYACAKAQGVALLCKGDDFIHTDIAIA